MTAPNTEQMRLQLLEHGAVSLDDVQLDGNEVVTRFSAVMRVSDSHTINVNIAIHNGGSEGWRVEANTGEQSTMSSAEANLDLAILHTRWNDLA